MRRLAKSAIRHAAWLCLLAVTVSQAADRNSLFDDANLLLLPRARPLPTFQLVDEQGQRVTADTFKGRWHLLFFGYTNCPDVCPTTLSDMRRLLAQLPVHTRQQLQVVLVSADPARDTPRVLRTYLAYYRAGFKGFTGKLTQLQRLSDALGLPFVPAQQAEDGYAVSHSGNLALVGPDAALRGHLRAPLRLEGLAKALPALIDEAH